MIYEPLTAEVHFYTAMIDQKPIPVFTADGAGRLRRIYEITENSVKV